MAASSEVATDRTERELLITRVFDAPRALVFKVWTAPEHLARWWGPRGFELLSYEADVRPGGTYRFGARAPAANEFGDEAPAGSEHWCHGVYREVTPPERLVFTWAWEEPDGTPKLETLVTVTFAERDGKTELTLHQALFESVTARDLHGEGWNGTLDLLADYLATL